MRLLTLDELPRTAGERVLRHSRLGGIVLLAVLAAPAVPATLAWRGVLAELGRLPGIAWVVAGPVLAGALLLWLLVLSAARSNAIAGLLETNWLLRASAAGIGLQLRSFRNYHFRRDVPSVLWLEPGEVRCARRVVESGWVSSGRGRSYVRRSWLELELAGVDCAAIEQRLDAERRDPGPEVRVLGVRMRTRANDTPVFLARPGVLRVEWLGRRMLEALRQAVDLAPELRIDLDAALGTALEPRVRALCARGMRMEALELARRERRLSLSEARKLVETLEKRAA